MYKIFVMAAMSTTLDEATYGAKQELGMSDEDFAEAMLNGYVIIKLDDKIIG